MNSKYITSIVLIFLAILGWNVFLIQRDIKLFEAYYACIQSHSHPDCPYKNK
jgi:hypothetical protein